MYIEQSTVSFDTLFILVKIMEQRQLKSDLENHLLVFCYENLHSIPKRLCLNKNYITYEDTLKTFQIAD